MICEQSCFSKSECTIHVCKSSSAALCEINYAGTKGKVLDKAIASKVLLILISLEGKAEKIIILQ